MPKVNVLFALKVVFGMVRVALITRLNLQLTLPKSQLELLMDKLHKVMTWIHQLKQLKMNHKMEPRVKQFLSSLN